MTPMSMEDHRVSDSGFNHQAFPSSSLLRPVFDGVRSILLTALVGLSPLASADRMVFHNIFQNNRAVEHQLSGINHIEQDPQGFMWFGGEKGLARYDGESTRIYRHDPNDPHSIANDYIRDLAVDRQGTLWIATESGLCYYELDFDRFACNRLGWPKETVTALAFDRSDGLYLGTSTGVYRISADRRFFSALPLPLNSEGTTTTIGTTSLLVDSQSVLWIGTNNIGLLGYDLQSKTIQRFQADPDRKESLAHNRISALALDHLDRLWVGTYGGGVSVLDPLRNQFQNHGYKKDQPSALSSNIIWDIFVDSTQTVWLAIDQGGLVRYAGERGFVAHRHKPYDYTSLASDQVRAIFEDRNGDLWLGAFPSGVSFHNRSTGRIQGFKHQPDNPDSLSHSSLLTMLRDSNGDIWIGTEDGLNLFDPFSRTFRHYRVSKDTDITARAVLSIAQYDNDTLWVGTWSGGLFSFDLRSHTFRSIDTGRLSGSGRNSQFIWDIMRDSRGNMWIATEFEGAGFYNRETDTLRFYSHDEEKPNGLGSNFVWALEENQQGSVWIATNGGLSVLHRGQDWPQRIKRMPASAGGLDSDRIVALLEDSKGRMWIGTQDNGAFIYVPDNRNFRHLGVKEGLPPSVTSGFVEDAQGDMWILTTNGLVTVNKDVDDLRVFGSVNGLTGNNFNRSASLLMDSGELYIGGADGLNIFNPADLGDDFHDFPVWLTALRVLNREIKPGHEHSPLAVAINRASRMRLGHHDTMFSLDFAGLNYRYTQDTRYAYKLVGFDQTWNDIGTSRTATYTNLPPGSYTFRVRASRGKDEWVESSGLRIDIAPAPWRSWWAYLSYLLGGSVLAYLVFHYYQLRGHTRLYKALSATDALTGIANRPGVTQAAQLLLSRSEEQSHCLIFIDIDHFKRINDTRGHDSGDRVLTEVASVLKRCLRRSDILGRWGGEEFVVIYSSVDRADGLRLAENIRSAIAAQLFDQSNAPLKVTLSLGCAFIDPGEAFESAVKRADLALYEAKNAGRNCIAVTDRECQSRLITNNDFNAA